MRAVARWACVAVVLAATAGCSNDATIKRTDFSQQDIGPIAAAAFAAQQEITSMRVRGTLTEGATRLSVEMLVSADGTCVGTITQGAGTMDIRQNPDGTWIRADRATLEATAGAELTEEEIKARLGKWSTTTQGHPLCSLDYWFDTFPIKADGTNASGELLEVGDEVRLGGIRTTELLAPGSSRIAYVSSVSPHRVLKVSNDDPQTSANLAFSDFGTEFVVERPPRSALATP